MRQFLETSFFEKLPSKGRWKRKHTNKQWLGVYPPPGNYFAGRQKFFFLQGHGKQNGKTAPISAFVTVAAQHIGDVCFKGRSMSRRRRQEIETTRKSSTAKPRITIGGSLLLMMEPMKRCAQYLVTVRYHTVLQKSTQDPYWNDATNARSAEPRNWVVMHPSPA